MYTVIYEHPFLPKIVKFSMALKHLDIKMICGHQLGRSIEYATP